MKLKPKFLDLFCGIGGLSLGLSKAGMKCIGGVDNWEDACQTYVHNHPDEKCLLADVSKLTLNEITSYFGIATDDIDIMVGGPPCQGFSTVGKRDKKDPRNKLWQHYLDLVSQIRPAYVLIENVEGLVVMDRGGVCESIVDTFNAIGYHAKWRLLKSADFGVPQLRKRVVFLATLDGLVMPEYPEPTVLRPVTVAEAISDLPALGPGEAVTAYSSPPLTAYQKQLRARAKTLANHEAAKHPKHLVELLSHIPDGGNRKSIPDHLQPASGFHNSYARLASNKPALAVTSNMRKPSSARSTHPTQNRGLTVREGLRLQSFEDTFIVLGSRTSQYLQVGNAVPPRLGEALGRELVRAFALNTSEQIARARAKLPSPVDSKEESQMSLSLVS